MYLSLARWLPTIALIVLPSATIPTNAAPLANVSFLPVDSEPLEATAPGAIILHDHWQMREEAMVGDKGMLFSSPQFSESKWYLTTVPTTALATLVRNKVYPDPIIGMNMMRIPDVNDAENARYHLLQYSHLPNHQNPWKKPYWFRTAFKLPANYDGRQIWLHFGGINYRADVWFNGKQIGFAKDVVGMFKRFQFNISKLAKTGDQENALAVRIHMLDVPGDPVYEQFGGLYGQMGPNSGDGKILKNVTMYSTVGWDWTPSVRDRNIGLWQHVWIDATGPVAVRDPAAFVDPKWRPGKDAPITVRGYTQNPSSKPTSVELLARIQPDGFEGNAVEVRQTVLAQPGRNEFVFKPSDHPELMLHDPKVWWPRQYGGQPLYKVTVTSIANGIKSNQASSMLGVRTIQTYLLKSGGRGFKVNGIPIRLSGGAWVGDTMLSASAQRYRDEVRLLADGNQTVVRVWGGSIMAPNVFFGACDRDGLLVIEEFSRTSSNSYKQDAADPDVLMSNMVDCVARMRSHPSIMMWDFSNEAVPQRNWAEPMMNEVLSRMDGTRPVVISSAANASWAPPTHMSSGGPWGLLPIKQYFSFYAKAPSTPCKDEIGLAGLMSINSIVKAIPDWNKPEKDSFPFNQDFGFHDATGHWFRNTDNILRQSFYPTPALMQYLWVSDLYTGTGLRAIYEAANKARPRNQGTLLWKINAAWPSMMWQDYDWYLRPNAGYYKMKEALKPIHVQYSADDYGLEVVNILPKAEPNLHVHAEVSSPTGVIESQRDFRVNVGINATVVAGSLAKELDYDKIHFLALTLTAANGAVLDRDVRWMQRNQHWAGLQTIPPAKVTAVVTDREVITDESVYNIRIENTSSVPAVYAWVHVIKGTGGQEVLPSFWNDDALTLMPHEIRHLTVRFRTKQLDEAKPHLMVEGFNVMPRETLVDDGKLVPLAVKLVNIHVAPDQHGNKTISMSYRNSGAAGDRYTSWPIPVRVDGKLHQYVHIDMRGSTPSQTTVAFAGLKPGEHVISVGYLTDPPTVGDTRIISPKTVGISFLPIPVQSKASSNSSDAANLFDAMLYPGSVGSEDISGAAYAADGATDLHPVIWTDYGKEITASGFVYAQRMGGKPKMDKVSGIKLWFFKNASPSGTSVPTDQPDETIKIKVQPNSKLMPSNFTKPHTGRYVVMQLMGKNGNPGGNEFRLFR